jgi:hypothetical protein
MPRRILLPPFTPLVVFLLDSNWCELPGGHLWSTLEPTLDLEEKHMGAAAEEFEVFSVDRFGVASAAVACGTGSSE